MKVKKKLSLLLVLCMVISLCFSTAVANGASFTDISSKHWAYNEVNDVVKKGIFLGTSSTKFEPETEMTRAMFVTTLSRIDGASVNNNQSSTFKDVPVGNWYTGAVEWAAKNGIVVGVSSTSFAPNDKITREQMATLIVRYADYAKITLPDDLGGSTDFSDVNSISSYAKSAVEVCRKAGLMKGMGKNDFQPKGNTTRAQCATLLSRYSNLLEEDSSAETYTVTFESAGGTKIASQTVKSGGKIVKPKDPVQSDATFLGWYSNISRTIKYDFNAPVTKNMTLYAYWNYTGGGSRVSPVGAQGRDICTANTVPNWEGCPSPVSMMLDYTLTNRVITAFGSLNAVTGFTGFNSSDAVQQSGYYASIRLPVEDQYVELAKNAVGTIVTLTGSITKNFTYADGIIEGTPGNYYIELILRVADLTTDGSVPKAKNFTLTANWDGTAGTYGSTTYTLDFSKITFKAAASVVKSLGKTSLAENGALLGKSASDLMNSDVIIKAGVKPGTYTAEGTLPYVTGYTGYWPGDDDPAKENQEGNYIAFDIVPPESFTAEGDTVVMKQIGGSAKTYTAAQFADGGLTMILRLTEESTSVQYEIDWDGFDAGNDLYASTTYTIDLSKLLKLKTNSSLIGDGAREIITPQTTPDWDGCPTLDKMTLSYSLVGGTVKGTGTLTKVTGFTGFNPSDVTQQSGFYAFVRIPISEANRNAAFLADAGSTVVILEGDVKKEFINTVIEGSAGEYYLEFLLHVAGENAVTPKNFNLTVDWDGAGTGYSATAYTIDFTGVTLSVPKGSAVDSIGKTSLTATGALLGKSASDLMDANLAITVGETPEKYNVTGNLKYVTDYTGYWPGEDDTAVENQRGHYLVFDIVPPSDFAATGSTVVMKQIGGSGKSYTAEQFADGGLTMILRVSADKSAVKYEIDWDGTGNVYGPTVYELNLSGLTLEPSPVV